MRKILPEISLRRAGLDDAEIIYQWRNHPEIRKYCLNPEPLDHEQHIAWYGNAIKNNLCVFLVAGNKGREIGIIRFDFSTDGADAEISIYVDPRAQGRGYGKAMLAAGEVWLRENRPATAVMVAKILPDNRRSVSLFEAAGFGKRYSVFTKEIR